MPDDDLVRVLSEIQRRGAIGRGNLLDAIAHADQYVAAAPPAARTAVDLGSGGGLPALVIAVRRPELSVTLVERRAKRVDLLRFGVRALGLVDRVLVVDDDVEHWLSSGPPPVDLVTARSFAPPLTVLDIAGRLLRPGGMLLISDPPSGAPRWTATDLARLGFDDDGRVGGVHRFVRQLR